MIRPSGFAGTVGSARRGAAWLQVSTPVESWLWRTLCDGFGGCVRRGVVLVGLMVARIGSVILVSHFFPI
jgi:hypothetical protein